MTIDDHIRDEKLQYDLTEKLQKYQLIIGKIDKYQLTNITGGETLPSSQKQNNRT